MARVPILTSAQCQGRIRRLAMEIWEQNADVDQLFLLGIAGQGQIIAEAIAQALHERVSFRLEIGQIAINKRAASTQDATLTGLPLAELGHTPIVLIDDVLNTGRVLAQALSALMAYGPPRVQVAVLVARNHGLFPIRPDFVGFSLSTTLEEHIEVRLDEGAFLS
jgi:pyrimidine operon attenuation protein / uracil phosphoribosyltransferase